MNNITQAQKNKLDYMDLLIKEEKSDKQRLMIEKNQRKKLINKRKAIISSINSKPFENKVYINSLPGKFSEKWINKSELTDEIISNEIALGFNQ